MKRVLSLLVDDNPGVLSRISGLFSRRCYNVDSITAGVTADPRFTRITIVTSGDELILSQIEKQVRKLEDVIYVTDLTAVDSVCRELMLVKVRVLPENRQSIMAVSSIFHGKVVDVTRDSMIIELTGSPKKIDGFMGMLEEYDIIEVSRTGVTGMARDSSEEKHLTGI